MSLTQPSSPDADKNKTPISKVPRHYLLFLLLTLFFVALLTIVNHYKIIDISKTTLMVFKWVAIAAIVGYAMYKRSLTTWILISMIVGAEFSYDLQQEAVKM